MFEVLSCESHHFLQVRGPRSILSWKGSTRVKVQTLCLRALPKSSPAACCHAHSPGQPVPVPYHPPGAEPFPNLHLTLSWHSSMPFPLVMLLSREWRSALPLLPARSCELPWGLPTAGSALSWTELHNEFHCLAINTLINLVTSQNPEFESLLLAAWVV